MDHDQTTDRDSLRTLSEEECLEMLSTTTVGRVAFAGADGIELLPLNFTVLDGEIYFRTATDTALHQLAEGADDVAFEIDHHSDVAPIGWNVTVKGSTSRVSDPDLYEAVMSSSRLRPWAGGTRGEVIHLTRRVVGGRSVHRR